MAFNLNALKTALRQAWGRDSRAVEEEADKTEALNKEMLQFWHNKSLPGGPTTLPVSANNIVNSSAGHLYANGHIGYRHVSFANVHANTGAGFAFIDENDATELVVEESTESEIEMAKASIKQPDRKRFKTIAMEPAKPKDVAPASGSFRVFYSENNEISGIGETDTLDNAALMVKASQYGPKAKQRKVVVDADKKPHIDVVDRNATVVRQYALL